MSGNTRQESTSRQTFTPPPGQRSIWDQLFQGTQQLYTSGGPQFYPGQTYTQPTEAQLAGREGALSYATGAGQQSVNTALSANNFWADPARVYDLNSIPGYGATRQAIVDTANRNLTENILPAQHLGGVATGNLGGSRSEMADALAMGRTGTGIAEALAGLDLGTAGQMLQANQAALNRAPQMFELGLQPANTQIQVGTQQRADTAEQIAAERERWDFEQNRLPRLLAMIQALGGTAGQYGGTTESKNVQEQSGGSGLLQGLGALLSIGSLLAPGGGNLIAPFLALSGGQLGSQIPRAQAQGVGTGGF